MPTARPKIPHKIFGHANKHRIRFYGKGDVDLDLIAQPIRQFPRRGVGLPRVAQPNIVGQQRHPRRGEKAHFRCKLARLFDAVVELVSQFFFEKNDQLARTHTVFRSTKTEKIDINLPGNFLWCTIECRDRICKTGAIHVNQQIPVPRKLTDRRNFITRINRSQLRRLRNANCARLMRMKFALFRHDRFCFDEVDLAISTADQKQL